MEEFMSGVLESGSFSDSKELLRELSQVLQPEAFDALRAAWLERELGLNNPNPVFYPADEVFERLISKAQERIAKSQ